MNQRRIYAATFISFLIFLIYFVNIVVVAFFTNDIVALIPIFRSWFGHTRTKVQTTRCFQFIYYFIWFNIFLKSC